MILELFLLHKIKQEAKSSQSFPTALHGPQILHILQILQSKSLPKTSTEVRVRTGAASQILQNT